MLPMYALSYGERISAVRTFDNASVNLFGHYLKIFWSVVIFDSILMVNCFMRPQWASKLFRHNRSMLMYIARTFGIRMFRIP